MSFIWGKMLLLLLLVPVIVAAYVLTQRRRQRYALRYASLSLVKDALGKGPGIRRHIPAGLFLAGLAVLIFALARPSATVTLPSEEGTVILSMDVSGSMRATDIKPSRMEAVKEAARIFITKRPRNVRIGIVAFSSAAVPLGPLTDDRDAAREALSRLPAPNGGTAIGDALALAARLLPSGGKRAIVLVTDGVNNAGSDPLEVASTIGAQGITIFTVGIGTNGSGELIPGTNEAAELDEEALHSIAQSGNGSYARVSDAGALRDRLGALARTTVQAPRRVDLTVPCALAAGVLAFGTALIALALGWFP